MTRIDPDIAAFNARLTASWAEHPPLDTLTESQMRDVAEAVRRPFRDGGPTMARTTEHALNLAGAPVRVRIHSPSENAPLPALIYLHGGGFTLFSIDTHDRLMREYAAAGGFAVVGVDYPLSPEHKYPVALNSMVALMDWLHANGPELGLRTDSLAIGGDSAGANLAVALSMRLRDKGAAPMKAMLLNYGAFSGLCSDEAEAQFGGPGAVLNRAEMDWFFANYLRDEADWNDPHACPILADLSDLPPALLVIPDQDLLAEQSHEMAQRFSAAGVPCEVEIHAGATHSFLEAMATAPLAMRAIRQGANWLKNHLTP